MADPGSGRRRGIWLGAVTGVVVAVIGVVILLTRHHASAKTGVSSQPPVTSSSSTAAPSTQPPASAGPTAQRLQTLSGELTSDDPTQLNDALDPVVADALRRSGQRLTPSGAQLRIDTSTLVVHAQTATVTATVSQPNAKPAKFTLLLLLSGTRWVIVSSSPA